MTGELGGLQSIRLQRVRHNRVTKQQQTIYMYVCVCVCVCVCESESCSVMSDSLQPHGLYSPWNSLGKNTGVGSSSRYF